MMLMITAFETDNKQTKQSLFTITIDIMAIIKCIAYHMTVLTLKHTETSLHVLENDEVPSTYGLCS